MSKRAQFDLERAAKAFHDADPDAWKQIRAKTIESGEAADADVPNEEAEFQTWAREHVDLIRKAMGVLRQSTETDSLWPDEKRVEHSGIQIKSDAEPEQQFADDWDDPDAWGDFANRRFNIKSQEPADAMAALADAVGAYDAAELARIQGRIMRAFSTTVEKAKNPMVACPECDKKVPKGTEVCPHCDAALEEKADGTLHKKGDFGDTPEEYQLEMNMWYKIDDLYYATRGYLRGLDQLQDATGGDLTQEQFAAGWQQFAAGVNAIYTAFAAEESENPSTDLGVDNSMGDVVFDTYSARNLHTKVAEAMPFIADRLPLIFTKAGKRHSTSDYGHMQDAHDHLVAAAGPDGAGNGLCDNTQSNKTSAGTLNKKSSDDPAPTTDPKQPEGDDLRAQLALVVKTQEGLTAEVGSLKAAASATSSELADAKDEIAARERERDEVKLALKAADDAREALQASLQDTALRLKTAEEQLRRPGANPLHRKSVQVGAPPAERDGTQTGSERQQTPYRSPLAAAGRRQQ